MAVTVLQLAVYRGAQEGPDGSLSMGEVEKTNLPFMGGCGRCGASVACYNSSPSTTGYIMCSEGCIGENGFETVEEANLALFPHEYEWKGPQKDTIIPAASFPSDYEACGECGYDHSYEVVEAQAAHRNLDGEGEVRRNEGRQSFTV